MYKYIWDEETGGLLLLPEISRFSNEPRPVYYKELDALGFDKFWNYPKDDKFPLMWAEANNYIYKGQIVAKTKGGALYTSPEIILLDKPEPDGIELKFVDIDRMIEKNRIIMEELVQETIQKVYNTYKKYKNKVDVFYVAFSGGKDSVVTLDIVQRALPHDNFIVVFADTQMEFSDTYKTVTKIQSYCKNVDIRFVKAKAEMSHIETWSKFGPPATVNRWCCNVHKTVPQVLLLRKILNKPDFTGMAFVGVRADESLARSKYTYITYGGKHTSQYSCNAILEWNSAEIFLYIYQQSLILNETYKKGNRRAGCLICPRAAERNDYMNYNCYAKEAEPLVEIIRHVYGDTFTDLSILENFIQKGGWKARKNGRDINIKPNYEEEKLKSGDIILRVLKPKTNWKVWINTIGVLANDTSPYSIKFQNKILNFEVKEETDNLIVFVDGCTVKENPVFIRYLKNIFRKSACCIGCRECQVECPYGYIDFVDGEVLVNEKCNHCMLCHKVDKGCLIYKSLEQPKGGIVLSGRVMSLNSYSHHAPKLEWLNQYFEYKNDFNEKNNLGSQMFSFFKRFLRDAKLLDESGFTKTAEIIEKLGLDNESSWGIIFTNLCYAPQVGWFVLNTNLEKEYIKSNLSSMMIEAGAKESWTNDIFSSLVRLSELPLGKVGFGTAIREKQRAVSIVRKSWDNPDPRVILYSLYKFAEACGDYYQFSLSTLLDDTIERDGVSPTRIFGLSRETMVPILNGLTVNYPEFISASFSLGLETIDLHSDKNAQDVLTLF